MLFVVVVVALAACGRRGPPLILIRCSY
ncbi:lipoprotein [Kushneria indalinina]